MSVISLCGGVGSNTGPIDCDQSRGVPKVPMFGSGKFAPIDYANSAAYQAALIIKINLATGNPEKMYPFPEIQNVVNNTEANTTASTGLGLQLILREGKPGYTFGVLIGSTLEKKLRKFNNKVLPMQMFDSNGNVWGHLDLDSNFVGDKVKVFCTGKPWSDGNGVETEYTLVTVTYINASEFYDYSAFVPTSFNISNLEGLVDVNLSVLSNSTNAYKIQGIIKVDQLGADQYIENTYPTQLASASLWEAKTGANFTTALTITSVADAAADDAHLVTFDSTAYTALASGAKIKLKMVDPPALLAADIRGIESVFVIITKP